MSIALSTTSNAGLSILISPAFSGIPTAPTASSSDSSTQIATTAYVRSITDLKAPLASPTFTGTVSGITQGMVGLANVDNTSDLSKPISDATQIALNLKAPLASPEFSGIPTAPTADPSNNTIQIATTAFVHKAISDLVDTSPVALNTLNELAAALGDDANFATTVTNSISEKAPSISPEFSGIPTAPTASSSDSSTQIATTAFVHSITDSIPGFAYATTVDSTDNSTRIATTAFVRSVTDSKAPLHSPAFTGNPIAPTAGTASNSVQIATTAFVKSISAPIDYRIQQLADGTNQRFADLTKHSVGLGSVDNTSDYNKPINTATQISLADKAPLVSPAFTGIPTAPTASSSDSSTQIATTAFVQSINTALQNSKAPIVSPTFSGTVGGITKSMVGLANVNDTSDLDKPISTATQNALNTKQKKIQIITSDPTSSTAGNIGDISINTTNFKLWIMFATSGGTYTWKSLTMV